MGKAKQKKNLSEKVQSGKKKKHDVKNNPFEVKINRQKFQVLGRKSKHDKGLPGISRSKAIKKRVETLLVEYKQKDKVNSFIDRRFGEFNPNMTVEEKMTKRFMMEHQRQLKKSDLFNLNKDEELTHYGRSLADGQGMTDFIESADDDDPDDRGLLSAEFTAAANFGGPGIERNTLEGEQAEKRNKSRKELLEEMIANSKMMKYEQQNERERAQDLTKKLDEQWKDIRLLLTHKGAEDKAPEIKKVESYDMVVRELGFEMKAQPTDRLKSAEELARQEQQRLQSLEADRLRRMRGEKATVASRRRKHESADDLHDDFHVEHHERTLLSYQDGKWNVDRLNKGAIEGGDDSNIVKQPEENEEVDYGDNDEEGSGAEFDEREEQKGKEEFGDDGDDDEEEGSGVESDGEEENMSNETDENGLLDFESKSDEASSAEEENVESEKVLGQNESDKSEKVESIQRMKTMCEAEGELPYVFAAPASLTELRKLLEQYDVEQQCTVIERMIKCNHPSLPESNKENLQNLFEFLLLYVGKLTRLTPPNLLAADKLTRSLFDLAHLFPKAAAHAMQDVLQKSQAKLSKKKHYPGLEELLFLKLISIIFPTSDFRHPIVTPAMVYMSQVLTQCPVQNLRQLSVGLFVCNLFLEFVSLSRRLVPELLTFLHGSLGQALPQPTTPDFQPPTSVWHASRCHALLVVSNQSTFGSWRNLRLPLSVLNTGPQTDDPLDCDHFRISALALTLELIRDCVKLYNGLPAFPELFHPIKVLLTQHLKLNNYPTPVQELAKVVCHSLMTPRTLTPMVYQKQKPTPIQMFHPKVEQVYESGHKKSGRKEELKQFQRHYQRELKGAVRELRKDNQFLARQQLAEQLERDAERRRKVKEIRHLLSTQEGEYKAMKKNLPVRRTESYSDTPGMSVSVSLLFLKLISIIFPTSDFRHPIVTPAMVYMSQVLTQCPVQNLRQLSVGLFVCNLFLEFVSLSRRLVPELLTFLHGSLGQALPQPTTPDFQPPTSVWHASRCHALLVVSNQSTFGSWRNLRLPLSVLNTGPQTDDPLDCDHFRISALALTLELIRDCVKLYNGLPAFPELFHPIKVLLTQHLKLNNYPTPVQELAKVVCHSLMTPRTLTPMVYQKQKPTPIQMFHPKVEQVYESGHKKSGRKEELKQFQRHYQRELKGAVRELRKDNQFLARQQLAEQLERDAERRRKVKEIRHLLSTQEGEYKAMKKKYVNF